MRGAYPLLTYTARGTWRGSAGTRTWQCRQIALIHCGPCFPTSGPFTPNGWVLALGVRCWSIRHGIRGAWETNDDASHYV